MSSNNSNSSRASGGIGFVGLLTILFIALKLCNVIDWSWLWVLSPLWISIGILVGLTLIFLAIAAIIGLVAVIMVVIKK